MESVETKTEDRVSGERRKQDNYLLKKLTDDLQYYRASYQREIILRYLTEVLPPIEAEQKAEQEHEQAIEDLLGLTSGKSVDEIHAMTAKLKT